MIWFTSDLHLGHANIIEYCDRPFDNVDDMNDNLLYNWNSVVDMDDTVYVLGDIAMGKIADTLPLFNLLSGYKILVPGNHDRCWLGHNKHGMWIDKYEDVGFSIVGNDPDNYGGVVDWQDDDGNIIADLNHFPFYGDSGDEDRYEDFRPVNHGQWLLHGHVHDTWRVRDRMINVGVDVWDYHPISLDTIKEIINE